MKLTKLFILLSAIFASAKSHSQRTCVVVDETNIPVSFAYVRAPSIDLLTVTSLAGKFVIPEKVNDSTAIVSISCLGFETINISIKDIVLSNDSIILHQDHHLIEEVVVTGKKLRYRNRSFGTSKSKLSSRSGYNFSSIGYERGIIVSNNETCKLSQIEFSTNSISVDSFKIELNLYDYSQDTIGPPLQTRRILYNVSERQENSLISIQLPEPVYIDGSFVVTIANLVTESNGVTMLESKNTSRYKRVDRTSVGWKEYEKDVPLIKVIGQCSK